MKVFKKIAGLLLAGILVLGMSTTALAANITIDNSETGHTYMVYQIFTGDLDPTDDTGRTLVNVNWGDGITDDGIAVFEATVTDENGDDSKVDEYADTLAGQDAATANELATTLVDSGYLQNGKVMTYSTADKNYGITGLDDGYYLVTDTSSTGAISAYIVSVVGGETTVTLYPKTDEPTFEKKVQDANDTDNTTTDWQDSADYDIGDTVQFQLTATCPVTNYSEFKTYYLSFEDNMSDGLDLLTDTIEVYHVASDGTETLIPDSEYEISYSDADDDDFKLSILNLKQSVPNAKGNDKIVVKYSAKLTGEDVVIGADGNPNTASITYQRDPNYEGSIIPGEYGEDDQLDTDSDGTPDASEEKDTDGDGIPDSEDTDDDNDGIPDDSDDDDDNDGIPDDEEDKDGDGIPDDEERDSDGDGIPDDSDDDDDNDGIPDESDDDDDGNGIPDDEEDKNGNGTPDVEEEDTDDDGTPDAWEEPSPADEVLGSSPKDKVTVFTYEINVNKIDEEGNPLEGAEFTLYKLDTTGTATGEGLAGYANYYEVATLTLDENDEDNNSFTYAGLDDGKYILVETKTPAGYNSIDPIQFEVSATHDVTSDDPALTELTVTPDDSFTTVVATGQINTDIVNREGAQLPTTGGIGTTIFYILGSVLAVGASVLLVVKRRMRSK